MQIFGIEEATDARSVIAMDVAPDMKLSRGPRVQRGIPTAFDSHEAAYEYLVQHSEDDSLKGSGAGPQTALVRRVRPVDHADWRQVTDPLPDVEVWLIDLMIAGSQMLKFEEDLRVTNAWRYLF